MLKLNIQAQKQILNEIEPKLRSDRAQNKVTSLSHSEAPAREQLQSMPEGFSSARSIEDCFARATRESLLQRLAKKDDWGGSFRRGSFFRDVFSRSYNIAHTVITILGGTATLVTTALCPPLCFVPAVLGAMFLCIPPAQWFTPALANLEKKSWVRGSRATKKIGKGEVKWMLSLFKKSNPQQQAFLGRVLEHCCDRNRRKLLAPAAARSRRMYCPGQST